MYQAAISQDRVISPAHRAIWGEETRGIVHRVVLKTAFDSKVEDFFRLAKKPTDAYFL